MGNSCAVHCVFLLLGSLRCTTESYLPVLLLLLHFPLFLHPSSWQSAAVTTTGEASWPYDEPTLALTGEAFLLIHTGTVTCRSTLFDREAQIQTHSDMYTHVGTHTHTHTNGICPLCSAMSLHSPGGRLSVVPCPQAIMLSDWFFSSCSSLLIGCRSV